MSITLTLNFYSSLCQRGMLKLMDQSCPKLGPLGGEEQGDCAGDAAAPEAGGPGHVLGGGGEVQQRLRGLHSPRRCGLHIKGDRRQKTTFWSKMSYE